MKKAVSLAFIVSFCVTIMAHGDVKAIQKRRITLDDLSKENLSRFLDDILNKRDEGGKEEDTTSCNLNFKEENGIILRTRDSIRRGAEFIAAPEEVDTVAECKEACCGAVSKKTSRHCDLALFQKTNVEDTRARCYLFSCSDENGKDVCVTSPNDDYMILQIKKEKVENELLDIVANSSTIKKETGKTEEKDKHGKCLEQFTNQSKTIIRTKDSIANGAVFLKAPSHADTQEDCQTLCCSTTDESSRHCDLAIFQTNHDDPDDLQPRCFLFSCTDENGKFHCVTSPNDDYVALKRTVDVEEDQLLDVAASSSTKPTTTTTTTASTTTTIIPTTSKLPSTTTTIIPSTSKLPSPTTASTRTKASEKQLSAHSQTCNRMQWKCDSGLCIRVTQVCDGKLDCSDKSDEKGCGSLLESSKPSLNADGKNVEFNLKPDSKSMKPQTQSSTTTKKPTTPKANKTTSPTNPPVEIKDKSGAQILDVEKNSQSTSNSLNVAKKDEFVVEKTEPQKGAVLPLALGLSVTACVLLMVACRFHIMKKKLRRRGKPLSMEESDYLINGMYL